MSALLVALSFAVNTLLMGFVARRLVGVPIGWPRTIVVSALILGSATGVAPHLIESLQPGFTASQRPSSAVTLLLVLMTAWCIAIGVGVLVLLEAMIPTGTLPRPLVFLGDLPARRRRSRRYAVIVAIAVRHGLGGFLRSPRRAELGEQAPRVARSLRLALSDGGVTFVKLGQMLSTRPDLVGLQFAGELGRLASDVRPQPWADVEATLRAELGDDPALVFASIDRTPLAAASIGQVHAATLLDGTPVVVKVQRSDARAQVMADMDIVRRLSARLERSTGWGRALHVRALADGFADSLDEELDYRIEAANLAAIRRSTMKARGVPVQVPKAYGHLSGPRVLVMERMPGTELGRAGEELAQLGPDQRAAMAAGLLDAVLRQMLGDGVFHADLHAGNVFLADDGQLGLLDFGSVGRLDSSTRSGMARLLHSIDRRDSVSAADALLAILDRPPELDDRTLERDLGTLMARSVSGADTSALFAGLMSLAMRHSFSIPPQVAAAFRALAALEGTLRTLDPQLDLIETARTAGQAQYDERLEPRRLRHDLEEQLIRVLPSLQRLPRRIDALADAASRGDLSMRVRVLADSEDRSFLAGLINQLTVTLLAATAGVCGVLLILAAEHGPEIDEGIRLYPVIGATLFLFAFVLAARALAVAFTHDARTHWGARR